jgi:gliding motility-associated-like protein
MLETTAFTVHIVDDVGCADTTYTIAITVRKEFSIDVAGSFTPNGDGINDVVYAKGWGIRKLLEFKIFNRWGNQVFSTDDITQGWDGSFNGQIQPVDAYVYEVKIESWDNLIRTKKGTIVLIR